MPMIVGESSSLKDIKSYLKRVNQLNDYDLRWRWYPDTSDQPLIEIYEEADRHTLCIAEPNKVISNIKRYMVDWNLSDPDDN